MTQKNTGFSDGAYVVVRTYSAGVFAGNLEARDGSEVVLVNARRLWYWDGAASLSQIALLGVSKPKSCKFSVAVTRELLLNAIEILETTPAAEENLKAVPEWRV